MSSNIDDSLWDSSSNDEQSNELEEEEEGEEEEEETRSQVTFDTNMTGADFLTMPTRRVRQELSLTLLAAK